MQITLDRLLYLKTVVDKGSFSSAAKVLGKSTAGIQQVIDALEIDLGITLFERTRGKGVSLTGEGKSFYLQAMEIIPQIEALEQKAVALRQGVESTVRIALHGISHFPFIDASLQLFRKEYPSVAIELLDAANPDSVSRSDIRVSLTPMEIERGRLSRTLFSFVWTAVVSTKHPLARIPSVLARADLLEHAQANLFTSELLPSIVIESTRYSSNEIRCENFEQYLGALKSGLAFGLYPKALAQPLIDNGQLCALNLDLGLEKTSWPLDISWSESVGPAAEWLVYSLIEGANKYSKGQGII
ncbi:LysR family transcriptional regulator [Paraferrimonas sedimenticola]|uniref:LysR family transcriptional regulator n=1 Tax=Paraferrimonas sedimenticola TaxID=375674 RepID=A0AA37RZ45_9GAMM|nr:LysR family transcriptional regulator [Paraferrimonas sedimenticola]GLP97619.1 LysR family transcriptional regulator [Paraferrimonas sedimenticola]